MKASDCKRCDGTGFEIVRLPAINIPCGYRQEAIRCDHKPVLPVHDGKMAAAGKDN